MAKKGSKALAAEAPVDLPAGPVDHMIEVFVDVENFRLEVQQPRSVVKPGDRVIWIYRGLPQGWLPWVDFPNHQPYGPFESVSLSTAAVWAVIPESEATTEEGSGPEVFAYRASIRKGLSLKDTSYGALLRSPLVELEVRNLTPTNLLLKVTYSEVSGRLEISNSLVKRFPGDTVEWVFEIPSKVLKTGTWQPRIDFFRFDGERLSGPPDLSLGPFSSLQLRTSSVVGAGSNYCPGIYSYVALAMALTSDSVHLESTPDPVIDDRGPVSSSGPG